MQVISVRHTIQLLQGRIIEGEPKSAGSRRTVALPELGVAILLLHQEKNGKNKGLLFTTSSGKPVSPRNQLRHFHQLLGRTGLPKNRFHELCHMAATLLPKEKGHPKIVQEMLGHSTISLTLDTYSHILPDIQ